MKKELLQELQELHDNVVVLNFNHPDEADRYHIREFLEATLELVARVVRVTVQP